MPICQEGVTTDLMIGTIFINFKSWGWSEKYIMGSHTAPSAVPEYDEAWQNLNSLAEARKYLLGNGCSIVWGRVSKQSALRDSVSAFGLAKQPALIDTETTVDLINNPEACIQFRMEDLNGRYANRTLRGVRDGWVADSLTVPDIFPSNITADTALTPIPTPPTLLTGAQAVKNYIATLMSVTVMAKKLSDDPLSWNCRAPRYCVFRGIKNRQTGRPFGSSRGRASSRV